MAEKNEVFMTPTFRASFPNLFKPRAAVKGAEEKYSLSMIFPKVFTDPKDKELFDKIMAGVRAAAVAKWGPDTTKWPANLKRPFHDGSEKKQDGYGPDVIFASASAKPQYKPLLMDHNKVEILDPNQFQGGDYARATITIFAYDNVSKGVGFGLRGVQKLRDGVRFGGGANAADAFDAIPLPEGSALEAAGVVGATKAVDPLGL